MLNLRNFLEFNMIDQILIIEWVRKPLPFNDDLASSDDLHCALG